MFGMNLNIGAIALAVSLFVNALGGWVLLKAHQEIGRLENINAALTIELKKLKEARRGREQTEDDVRRIPDSDLGRGLRE